MSKRDTEEDIRKAFEEAAADFNASLAMMRPYRNESEGYCEANLVAYFAFALRQVGYWPFLELPVVKGRIDAVFCQGSTFLLAEAKQLHRESVAFVAADLARMALLDLPALLKGFGYTGPVEECYHVAICDCWSQAEEQQWMARPAFHSFLKGFTPKVFKVEEGHHHLYYAWLLAYAKAPCGSASSLGCP